MTWQPFWCPFSLWIISVWLIWDDYRVWRAKSHRIALNEPYAKISPFSFFFWFVVVIISLANESVSFLYVCSLLSHSLTLSPDFVVSFAPSQRLPPPSPCPKQAGSVVDMFLSLYISLSLSLSQEQMTGATTTIWILLGNGMSVFSLFVFELILNFFICRLVCPSPLPHSIWITVIHLMTIYYAPPLPCSCPFSTRSCVKISRENKI